MRNTQTNKLNPAAANSSAIAAPERGYAVPDNSLIAGWILITLNGGILYFAGENSLLDGIPFFFSTMGIAGLYTLHLMLAKKLRWFWQRQPESGAPARLLASVLWLISCFTLNIQVPLFSPSDNWLSICILLLVPASVVFGFRRHLNTFWNNMLFFVLALQLALWTYFSLRLVPAYPFGLAVSLIMGIGLHTFVPAWLSFDLFMILKRAYSAYKRAILAGFFLPVAVAAFFVHQYAAARRDLKTAVEMVEKSTDRELPDWVQIAQRFPVTFRNEMYLMSGLRYDTFAENSFMGLGTNRVVERQHNPFAFLASLIRPVPDFTEKDRGSILEIWSSSPASPGGVSRYLGNIPYLGPYLVPGDLRHQMAERFWSGKDLRTSSVATSVAVYPGYRIAYTEKLLKIQNTRRSRFPGEALYTFYLPDGAAVTSLSLWVAGKEEKGILTTRHKADSAYTTIVGIESRAAVRDPSVVHWQEGSRVTVRVFPCSSFEERQFKIGITSPLRFEEDRLYYENIPFLGPSPYDAPETMKLSFVGPVEGFRTSVLDFAGEKDAYSRQGTYTPHWAFSVNAPPLLPVSFSFLHNSYSLHPYQKVYEAFRPARIFLDINKAWTRAEFEAIVSSHSGSEFWAYDGKWQKLTSENQLDVFRRLNQLEFSLMPVHTIQDPDSSLLVTKGTRDSPLIRDLKNSDFARGIARAAGYRRPVRAFVLGDQLSPYQMSLKELRILRIDRGSLADLSLLIGHGRFLRDVEQEQSEPLLIPGSAMVIARGEAIAEPEAAPDHLLRLFAYHHILKGIGSRYFSDDYALDELVKQAETANVVTPVSSLVVLETQRDYERFNISKSKKSLDNASMQSAGAVPEPHEWALIALLLLFVLFTVYRQYGSL